ncbi:uncharacterized protein LOC110065376 [Orbicella faveolata]|uniref:uncharacterized protein LOC110065376 n=1 Tax=Orbicella faveolata TaxID=48498 RepID=UPI0009E4873C|nr:uncharacterized protein LOC110065376 [Orbicella faveolata]
MVLRFSPFRFPSWSFADWAQFELDTLEDIFKRSDWQERALKPALSSILAPALCAVYASYEDKSISNLEDDHVIWDRHYTLKDLSSIEVKIQRADSPTSSRNSFFLPIGDDRERPRSPELLYPPIANIAEIKEKLPPPCDSGRSSPIFVSGYEAERQRNDIKQFGREVASKLAERRAEYAKRRMNQLQEENEIIERNIEEAVKSKMKQLQMADHLEKDGTFLKDRRAKLWRRCANMAEILAKEETEAILWQKRYKEAIAVVSGSFAFF